MTCVEQINSDLNRNSLKIQMMTSTCSTCKVFASPSLQDIHQPFWDRWANVEAVPLDNMLNISEISRDLRFDKKECSYHANILLLLDYM